jgi:predicted kinase
MVVSNYLLMSANVDTDQPYKLPWLCGALACAFHDVGKPSAEETLHSPERGTYHRYGGHEQISARLWENWAVTNFDLIRTYFPHFTVRSIYVVGWIIEHHLPFSTKDKVKLSKLTATAKMCNITDIYGMCLKSDCLGRMSDDHDQKIAATFEWVDTHLSTTSDWLPHDSHKVCWVLIGASGSGKSTYSELLNGEHHNMDKLRLEWYGDDYTAAFTKSCDDPTFKNRVQQHFLDIVKRDQNVVVDNVNLTPKSRNFYVTEARRRGYEVHAAVFPLSLDTLLSRRNTRSDKTIPEHVVIQHYNSLVLPSYVDFDYISVVDGTSFHK